MRCRSSKTRKSKPDSKKQAKKITRRHRVCLRLTQLQILKLLMLPVIPMRTRPFNAIVKNLSTNPKAKNQSIRQKANDFLFFIRQLFTRIQDLSNTTFQSRIPKLAISFLFIPIRHELLDFFEQRIEFASQTGLLNK